MKHQRGAKQQRGATLVELAIFVAAALVLLGVGLAAWARVDGNTKSARLISMVSSIDDAVRKRFTSSWNYDGLDVDAIRDWLPGDIRPASGCGSLCFIRSPFGGGITLAPSGRTAFTITISGSLPTAACTDLVTQLGTTFWTVETERIVMKTQSSAAIPADVVVAGCRNVENGLRLTGT